MKKDICDQKIELNNKIYLRFEISKNYYKTFNLKINIWVHFYEFYFFLL